jgi:hypothetical protein
MNKKVFVLTVALMTVATLVTPVLAIGPIDSEGNPNTTFPAYGVALNLPSGVFHEWVQGSGKHLTYKDAAEFKIKNAIVVTDVTQVSELENKWIYFSVSIWGDWLAFIFNLSQYIEDPQNPGSYIPNPAWIGVHNFALSHFPDGVYYKEGFVGE